jgi:hypothetical protein
LGEPQSRSGRHGEEKIIDPTGTQTLIPSGGEDDNESGRRIKKFKLLALTPQGKGFWVGAGMDISKM